MFYRQSCNIKKKRGTGVLGVRLSISLLQTLRATIALCALAGAGETARAEQKVGSTAAVINEVTSELSGAVSPLKPGDAVFRNEVVRTAAASKAKLVFLELDQSGDWAGV